MTKFIKSPSNIFSVICDMVIILKPINVRRER